MDTQAAPVPAPIIGFDFNQFEDAPCGEFSVRHPQTGAPTSMVIVLVGPEHPTAKRLVHERQRRMRAEMARLGKMPVVDPQQDEEDQLERACACTLGWRGAAVSYSADAARAAYSDPKRRWLLDQVLAALDERERFISPSANP